MGCTLAHQPAALSVRASQILLVDTWDAHQRPNMSLAPAPGDQRTQQHLDVDSVGLNSSPAPVYLEAARVDHKALNAAPHEEPRQPERVIAYFVADGDCWRRTAHLGPAVSGCSKLCHQLFRVSAFDWIEAPLLPLRQMDRQKAAGLSPPQRAVKSIRRNRTGGCLVHLIISLDCNVWTKESTGRFRRAFVRLIASSQTEKNSVRAYVFRFTPGLRTLLDCVNMSQTCQRHSVVPSGAAPRQAYRPRT